MPRKREQTITQCPATRSPHPGELRETSLSPSFSLTTTTTQGADRRWWNLDLAPGEPGSVCGRPVADSPTHCLRQNPLCHLLTVPPANATCVKWGGPACGSFHCLNKKAGLFMKIKCLGMDCPILQNLGMHQPPPEHLLSALTSTARSQENPRTPATWSRP